MAKNLPHKIKNTRLTITIEHNFTSRSFFPLCWPSTLSFSSCFLVVVINPNRLPWPFGEGEEDKGGPKLVEDDSDDRFGRDEVLNEVDNMVESNDDDRLLLLRSFRILSEYLRSLDDVLYRFLFLLFLIFLSCQNRWTYVG